MNVSEIEYSDIARYLKIDTTEIDEQLQRELNLYLDVAKNYIENYTGIPQEAEGEGETLDSFQDFVIVVYILCQDMYDNRTMYVDTDKVNKVVQSILDMHTRNNL